MKNNAWHIGVVIPGRNEEALLSRCLESVLAAKDRVRSFSRTDIVFVSDSSTDRTTEIATELLRGEGTVRCISVGAVGLARRFGVSYFLDKHRVRLQRCWIANTDADCTVPADWLLEQLALAELGVEAVAGTVSVDSFEGHGTEVPGRFRSSYLIEPDGSHPHVHGANIGFRADAYLRAGGWSGLCTAEDHDLWRRLSTVGARKYSTSRVEVQTSGRRLGRAPNGFADALAAHNETAA